MATEPLNLIQVQSRLQDPLTVTNQDLLKYANGANPEVPSFLALIEMNRRKQIEDTTAQFQSANIPSVKDQLAQSLTSPTMTGGDKMIQVNPTNAPIGIINPTRLSQRHNPTARIVGRFKVPHRQSHESTSGCLNRRRGRRGHIYLRRQGKRACSGLSRLR